MSSKKLTVSEIFEKLQRFHRHRLEEQANKIDDDAQILIDYLPILTEDQVVEEYSSIISVDGDDDES